MKRTTSIGLLAAGLAATVALSACSSSSKPAASGGSSGGSGTTAKIMVIGDFTSTIPFTLPEIVPTVKGVLKDVKGVQILTCDAKGVAGSYLTCEHNAQSAGVAAVITGFSAGGQDQTLLTKAGIPVVGNSQANAATGFPVSESFSLYVAEGVGLGKTGCKKLGIIYLDGSDFLVNYIKQGFESTGGKEVARAAVAANAADLAPAVSKLTGAGAQCVAISLAPAGGAQALTALKQSGKDLQLGSISAIFSAQVLAALPPTLTNNLLVIDDQLNATDPDPGIQAVSAALKSEDPNAKVTQQAISAWVAAKLVAAAMPTLHGKVTAKMMLDALNGLRNVDMQGVVPPYSAEPLNNPVFSRLFNHYGLSYKIQGGKPVRQGDFYDLAPILQAK